MLVALLPFAVAIICAAGLFALADEIDRAFDTALQAAFNP